ncbi:MAG: LCP family protein [Anaerolineae bacterium]
MAVIRTHRLIQIVSLIVMLSSVAGCVGLAEQPIPISQPAFTATPRPTVTPLIPDTPFPTFTDTPTPLPTFTPTPVTPTATPTLPPRPRLAGELGVEVTITPGLVISGTPIPIAAPIVELPQGTINVLLLGVDSRPGEKLGRTDTIIVVSINPGAKYVTMLSLPRDLWVYLPGTEKFDRINTADIWGNRYKLGDRVDFLAETIRYNLGIPVNYYAIVNFAGVQQIIDKIGGIDVLAQCPLYDVFPDLPPDQSDIITDTAQLSTVPTGTIDIPTPGLYQLDGKHALWFARSRYSTNDFERSRRQQNVLKAVWAKIKQQGLVAQLPNLWSELTSLVTTNLTLNDVIYLAGLGTQLDDTQIKLRAIDRSVVTPFVTDTGAQVLALNSELAQLVIDEAFTPPLTNVAAQASARVEVENGTGWTNYDLLAVDRLTTNGFVVPSYGPADQVYSQTQIINFASTTKGSRLNQLVRLFNVKANQVINQPDPNSAVALRVIVGRDFDPCKPPAPPVALPTPTPTPAPTATLPPS